MILINYIFSKINTQKNRLDELPLQKFSSTIIEAIPTIFKIQNDNLH